MQRAPGPIGPTQLRPAAPAPAQAQARPSRAERKAARVKVDTLVAAPIGRRVAASLIDLVIVAVPILWPLYQAYNLDESWLPPLVLALGIVLLVATTVCRGQYGFALGGWLLKVRTIRDGDAEGSVGAAPGVKAMAMRNLVSGCAALVLLAPVWSMLLDSSGRRRAWQDKAAGTRVIDIRWGANPLAVAAPEVELEPEVPGEFAPTRGRARPAVLASGVDMTPVLVGGPPAAAEYAPNYGARLRSGPDPTAFAVPNAPIIEPPVRMEREAVDRTVAPLPPAVPAGPESEAITSSAVVLEFDTGERVTITGTALVGRDPEQIDGQRVDHLVPLLDNTRTVSKSHVRIALVAGNLLIEDFHSTNGSAIEYSGARLPLVPGTPVPAPLGSTVHMGSRTFRVLPA